MSQPRKKAQPHKGWKGAARKSQELPCPTERQIEEAMVAFERAKVRYKLRQFNERLFVVLVEPEWLATATITAAFPPKMATDAEITKEGCTTHRFDFTDEASARRWREREIIRESITAGMRAKP